MTPSESKQALRKRLKERVDRTVVGALREMLDFYAQERADGCLPVNDGGDMLLFQWGTYDWGEGERFELNLTRQFILPGEDEPYQLSMTLRFEPTDECRQLGDGDEWCDSPDELSDFRDTVLNSAACRLLGGRTCPRIAVDYGQC